MSSKMSRRGVFGYASTAGISAAAGVITGRAAAGVGGHGHHSHSPEVAAASAVGHTYAAHGEHQAGIFTPKPAAGELVAFDLLPSTDVAALARLMRVWSTDIAALMAGRPAAGDSAPDMAQAGVSLTILVGLGPGIFDLDGLNARRPAGFQTIPPMDHDRLEERWSGGDLLIWVSADDAVSVAHAARHMITDASPFATPRWRQRGSWRPVDATGAPVTGRNLFGQVDGTANPSGDPALAAVLSQDDWLSGGTQLVIRRIEMNLSTWDEVTRDRQEAAIGRDLAHGAPLTGGAEHDDLDLSAVGEDGLPVIAVNAHARLSHPTQNSDRRMLRRGLNYTHEEWVDGQLRTTSGLIFTAFQASIADQFIPVQRKLDLEDALNEWTTAIGSAVFAIPRGFHADGWLAQELLS